MGKAPGFAISKIRFIFIIHMSYRIYENLAKQTLWF